MVNEDVILGLQQKEIFNEMMADPNLAEVKSTIDEVNTGKAPGLNGKEYQFSCCGLEATHYLYYS